MQTFISCHGEGKCIFMYGESCEILALLVLMGELEKEHFINAVGAGDECVSMTCVEQMSVSSFIIVLKKEASLR